MTGTPIVPVLDETSLEDQLHRHRAFWTRGPVDRPMVTISQVRYTGDKPVPGEATRITPEKVRDQTQAKVASLRASYEHRGVTRGDLFTASPFPTPPWMEAVLGCPIQVFDNTSTSGARHCRVAGTRCGRSTPAWEAIGATPSSMPSAAPVASWATNTPWGIP